MTAAISMFQARLKSRRLATAAVATSVLAGLLAQSCSAADPRGQCAADEVVAFTCSTGDKTVSVCASSDLSAQAGWIQYRFGPPGAPELVLPRTHSHPRGQVQAGTWTFAGGGGAFMEFANPPYSYAVYTAIGRGWGEKAGVAVQRDGKRVSNLPCRGPVQSELGPDLFDRADLDNRPEAFDLP